MFFTIGILSTMVLILFKNGLIDFFNTKDLEVEAMSKLYLIIVALGNVFSFSNQVFTGIFNGRGDSKSPFKINATGLMINIVLDPILILGFGPIPAFGVAGAAIATIFAQLVVFSEFIYFIKFKHSLFQHFSFLKKPDLKYIESVVMMGVPTALQSGLFTFISMSIARMISVYGATPIAVQKVGSQIEAITWMTAGGFSVALSAFVGQNYGAKQFKRVLEGYYKAMGVAIVLGISNSLLLYFGARLLFMIFIREPVAIVQGIDYLRILAISQLFMCIEITTTGASNGIGKTKPPAITSIFFNILRIPFAYYLSTQTTLGLNGIWWAISISSIFKGVIIFVWFKVMVRKSPEFASAI